MPESIGLIQILGLSFMGGLVLNVMPCVLPVLTMKVFHLVEYAHTDPRLNRAHGIAYTAGVLVTFLAFALGVIALKYAGHAVGWGMQFTNPAFVATLTALVVVFGMNALGVFELSLSVAGHEGKGGVTDSFVNGIFASVMSTPCTAPFLSTAATFALSDEVPAWNTLLVFSVVGLGLASPFTAVSFIPGLARILPRPGAWMETFKVLMGFTLLGAAVWLFGTLMHQVTSKSATGFLYYLLFMAVALWLWQRFGGPQYGRNRRLVVTTVTAVALAGVGFGSVRFEPRAAEAASTSDAVVVDGHINWAPFDVEFIAAARASGRPVFIDYTAEWCANCKTNERLFIETEAVHASLEQTGIIPVKADLTNDNEVILQWLDDLGRSGLPAYAIYMPDGTVDALPQVITTELLLERFAAASERFGVDGFGPAPRRPGGAPACPPAECPVDVGAAAPMPTMAPAPAAGSGTSAEAAPAATPSPGSSEGSAG